MLLSINPLNPNPLRVKKVVNVLKNDGIIIYPTDTVYGLGCSIFSKKAMKRLHKIKKVNQKKPLTLSVQIKQKFRNTVKAFQPTFLNC